MLGVMQETAMDGTNIQKRNIQPLLYTKRDVAALLSLSLRTIDNLISGKDLPAIRVRGRVMVRANDLQRFITARPSAQRRIA
jgi:excisionase family DNA binding protein